MANWFDGVDAAVLAHITKSGWDKLDPTQAAVAAARSHLEAQNYIGVPEAQLIRVPSDPNDPSWKTVWSKLGAAADAKGYDFSTTKYPDGTAAEESLVAMMQNAAVQLGLPVKMAQGIMTHVLKYIEDDVKADAAKATATLNTEREALKTEWGANHDANVAIAKKAAEALGVKPETVNEIEKLVGYQGILKMFHSIGTKIGEDKFQGGNQGGLGLMNKEQASARMLQLKADEGWREKVLKGDVDANQELANLSAIIAGGDDTADSMTRTSAVVTTIGR